MKIFVDAEMELQIAASEPSSASFCQMHRFWDLSHAEKRRVKPARLIFPAGRHRQLHVINRGERRFRHAPMLTENRKPEARPC